MGKKKSALADTQITISALGRDPITMSGEEFEKKANDIDQKLNGKELPLTIRSLRYDFTAIEIHDFSLQLANKTKELSAVEEEKKSITSQFSAKINEAKATCNKLSNFISNGYEYRDIECIIEYHKPEQGRKTITRKDNNVSFIENMHSHEWNLFNQANG
jgi:hypothetical protein